MFGEFASSQRLPSCHSCQGWPARTFFCVWRPCGRFLSNLQFATRACQNQPHQFMTSSGPETVSNMSAKSTSRSTSGFVVLRRSRCSVICEHVTCADLRGKTFGTRDHTEVPLGRSCSDPAPSVCTGVVHHWHLYVLRGLPYRCSGYLRDRCPSKCTKKGLSEGREMAWL